MNWWSRNAESIEAVGTTITACAAVIAIVGAKIQLDHVDRIQREQSARDAYRTHLSMAASLPEFARPNDVCSLIASKDGGAYEAYVEHLLYAAEQMLSVEDGWSKTFTHQLSPHIEYLCSASEPIVAIGVLGNFLNDFKDNSCPSIPTCQSQ